MVDARDFYDVHIDSELESRAAQLHVQGAAIPREDKRGTAHKHMGHIRLGDDDHALLFDAVVCDLGAWAMTLITDVAPPMRREIEIEWEDESGMPKRTFGMVTGTRHGNRVKDPSPDLFYSRFESSFV